MLEAVSPKILTRVELNLSHWPFVWGWYGLFWVPWSLLIYKGWLWAHSLNFSPGTKGFSLVIHSGQWSCPRGPQPLSRQSGIGWYIPGWSGWNSLSLPGHFLPYPSLASGTGNGCALVPGDGLPWYSPWEPAVASPWRWCTGSTSWCVLLPV